MSWLTAADAVFAYSWVIFLLDAREDVYVCAIREMGMRGVK